jgi:hypothetical protein
MVGPQSAKSSQIPGGEKGIRTPGTLTGTPDFESGTFGLSVISPPRNLFDRPHPCQGDTANRRPFPHLTGTLTPAARRPVRLAS